jgi:AcrR family transcriptional regulator
MTDALTAPSARADLAALTQARVMRGVAAIIEAGGDLTFKALSQASGVPERTLYRHYPTREAVLAAFWSWLNARLGMPPPPASAEALVASVPALFAAFEADERLVRAMLHDPQGRATRHAQAEARRARLLDALAEVLAPLDETGRRRLLASVQALASAATWESMKDNWGLSTEEAGDAAQWAIAALVAQARHKD